MRGVDAVGGCSALFAIFFFVLWLYQWRFVSGGGRQERRARFFSDLYTDQRRNDPQLEQALGRHRPTMLALALAGLAVWLVDFCWRLVAMGTLSR